MQPGQHIDGPNGPNRLWPMGMCWLIALTLVALVQVPVQAQTQTQTQTQVQASDAGHAKKLVQAQYGSKVTVLSVKRVD